MGQVQVMAITDQQKNLGSELHNFVMARVVHHKLTLMEAIAVLDTLKADLHLMVKHAVAQQAVHTGIAIAGADALKRLKHPGKDGE